MSCLYVIMNGMQWTDRIRQVKILLVISAIVIAVVSLLVSLPFSAKDFASARWSDVPASVGWELAYVIFFATFVAYFLIPYGQKRIRPTLVSMYTYLQPIIAAIVSIITGLDMLTWQKLLATLLVFAGVYLVMRSRAAAA